jgi:hypothetical protein
MGYTAIVGDRATTTALAVASAWPGDGGIVLVEADPEGGSLAAWLELAPTPSLSTAVATVPNDPGGRPPGDLRSLNLAPLLQHGGDGIGVLVAPMSGREARRAVEEAGRSLLPVLAGLEGSDVLVDGGRLAAGAPLPSTVRLADRLLVCHRQEPASAAAASVRLQRLVETTDALSELGRPIVLAVIGGAPYPIEEIGSFVLDRLATTGATVRPMVRSMPEDPVSAKVFAGRSGLSARRLARRPLMRAAGELSEVIRSLGDGAAIGAGAGSA